jgi:hypothetical protein
MWDSSSRLDRRVQKEVQMQSGGKEVLVQEWNQGYRTVTPTGAVVLSQTN